MLNGWHVRWVCWPCKNWDLFSFQELCTDPLQHGAVHYHAATWGDGRGWNGTTMGLRISSRYLCAFKMPSIKCTRVRCPLHRPAPYHNPTATMGHSIHNIDNKQTAHPHDAIHAVCHLPCTVKTRIHPWREHLSKVPDAIECEHLPKSVTTTNCSQVETPMRMTSMQMSFPETVSDSLCRNYLLMQTDCCSSCPGG